MNSDSEDEVAPDISAAPSEDLGTEEDFFDAEDGRDSPVVGNRRISNESARSPSLQDQQNYTQLKNFAGLSSPFKVVSQTDEQASLKESVISSLSSMSDEDHRHNVRRASQETVSSEPSDTNKSNHEQSIYRRSITNLRKALIYKKLFGLKDDNNIDNPIFKDRVRVSSVVTDKNSIFREKIRLAQVIRGHEGAIWAMKFSPSGNYICTAGQDKKVIVWCVGNPLCASESSTTEEGAAAAVGGGLKSESMSPPRPTSSSDEKNTDPSGSSGVGGAGGSSSPACLIYPQPYRILEGHEQYVIDIAWSKSNFILSASTDHTVRLWHVTRGDCLQYFRHPDIVTSVEFHPLHDRYFISGCFDRRLRVWDIIPDGSVKNWQPTPDTITSVAFTPDGKKVAGGLINGQIHFFDYEGMKHVTIMPCRNRAGKYKNGKKITGICFQPTARDCSGAGGGAAVGAGAGGNVRDSAERIRDSGNHGGTGAGAGGGAKQSTTATSNTATNASNVATKSDSNATQDINNNNLKYQPKDQFRFLVTTNDNRIRLCTTADYSLICKYKEVKNKYMQIRATFSDDGRYIICGSENGKVCIWNTEMKKPKRFFFLGNASNNSKTINRNPNYESFDGTVSADVATTVAIFAPSCSATNILKLYGKEFGLDLNQVPVAAASGGGAVAGGAGATGAGGAGSAHGTGGGAHDAVKEALGSEGDSPGSQKAGTKERRPSGDPTNHIASFVQHSSASSLPAAGGSTSANKGVVWCGLNLEDPGELGSDFGTRMIVTADYDGNIRVFVRLS